MDSDERILGRFRQGDAAAFEELVRRYEAALRNVAFGFLRDHALAEDVAQDVFLTAYRKLSSLRRGGSVKSWLFRIAINRAQDELRRIKRKLEISWETDDVLPHAARPASGEALAASRELGRHIAGALAEMRTEYRIALVLREVEGFSYAEIAKLLHWPLGTVQARIHRGRLALRARLRQLRGMEI